VIVRELSVVRRGAPQAQLLYEETADSLARREAAAALRKAGALGVQTDGRPSKKQRRQLHQFRGAQDA
jgi:ribosome-associated heat shock protein Hsp15